MNIDFNNPFVQGVIASLVAAVIFALFVLFLKMLKKSGLGINGRFLRNKNYKIQNTNKSKSQSYKLQTKLRPAGVFLNACGGYAPLSSLPFLLKRFIIPLWLKNDFPISHILPFRVPCDKREAI